MLDLPIEITRKIYEYDPTYRYVFNKVLVQLKCNFFIYYLEIIVHKNLFLLK